MLRISPRFVVLLAAMCLSIAFLLLDILSVVSVLRSALPTGINPFWKVSSPPSTEPHHTPRPLVADHPPPEQLSFSFKCLTDTVILDDFKTALDKMHEIKMRGLVGVSMSVDLGHAEPVRRDAADDSPTRAKRPPRAEHVDRI